MDVSRDRGLFFSGAIWFWIDVLFNSVSFMTNKTEWKIITILEQLRDAGLPEPDYTELAKFIESYCWSGKVMFFYSKNEKNSYKYQIKTNKEIYNTTYNSLPEAIAKLKELLGEGDE